MKEMHIDSPELLQGFRSTPQVVELKENHNGQDLPLFYVLNSHLQYF